MTHFSRWGMEIHAGTLDPLVHSGLLEPTALPPIKGSKSEVLRFAARHASHSAGRLAPFCGSFHSVNLKKTGRI